MSGRLLLIGSGETAPGMVATHRAGIESADADSVLVLDTPFGFQTNAGELTDKLVGFFRRSLAVDAEVASLPAPGASPPEIDRFVAAVRRSRYVFAGPGSPSYAMRVWADTSVADAMVSVVQEGGTVALASAAALTAGSHTIPVYEIYKAGLEPYWVDGLDLTGRLGIPSVVVPHWDNQDGETHDTTRCYIGEQRLRAMSRQLDRGILGVDEHTSATIDFGTGVVTVRGRGGVTLRSASGDRRVTPDEALSLPELATGLSAPPPEESSPDFEHTPEGTVFDDALAARDVDSAVDAILRADRESDDRTLVRAMIIELGEAARSGMTDPRAVVGGFVDALLTLRAQARDGGDFAMSDQIRDTLADLDIEVRDTPDGAEWEIRET